jgi:isoleucyl-tRNA synthetase
MSGWKFLLQLRDAVLVSLEAERKVKRIGKSLEAAIRLCVPALEAAVLGQYSAALKELFNVAAVHIDATEATDISVTIVPADGTKCGRCWNYRTDIAAYGPWPEVCGRCAEALDAMGYSRETGERGAA